jgi:hypothetical protein
LMLTLRMLKENTLPLLLRTERSIKSGESSTLTQETRRLPRAWMSKEACMSIHLSSLFQECG